MQNDVRVIGSELGVPAPEVELDLRIAGASSKVFFRASEPILETSNEALIACSLLPAMASGMEVVDLAGPTSARLVSALPTIVDIMTAWNKELTPVSYPSLVPVAKPRSSPGRVGAFFSGGVDAFYTFLKCREQVTDIIFLHGAESALGNAELLKRAAANVDAVASEFGVSVVHVETNLKPFLSSFADWGLSGHGVGLATVGHLLAPAFERIYIGSSVYYGDLFPWGSHPLLDPLWSSEVLEFVHHGCAARRIEKVEFIAGFDAALNNLRVCPWGPGTKYEGGAVVNCGRCEKCIRTMMALEVAGKLSQCTTFDRPLESRRVSKLRVYHEIRAFYEESLEALRRQGVRPDLQRALKRCLRGHRWRRARRKLQRKLRKLFGIRREDRRA
jgi:hypothetical protein